ncbi:E3 ubiquitin- ligase DZIP3 [Paramuricea clavata]|uniref:E3 ubiquitin- ligase DZIP3 n=1 Tax=Paramuricea clavata TaxID=317549 RepID=A0A6S7IL11_PARCT|nr:E3 ubiquitin- ligase DZIP3 [Paramuricea clavata]
MASSVLESSVEKIYGFKLMRLIVDGGTEVLRNIFLSIHPGNLHAVLSTHCPTLYPLFKTKKIITQPQWDKLYPPHPSFPNIQEFDITLLVILLRNICSLSPPSTGWNVMPGSTENSREANIVRIRLFRNNFFGHVPGTDVSRLDFEAHWVDVSSALRGLGLKQSQIDRLKAEECGEEEVNRVRKEWNESDKEIVIKLNRMEKKMESKFDAGFEKVSKKIDESLIQVKSSTKGILSECLHEHDFKNEIQSFYENYTECTREWVFNQVSKWLNDKLSNNRAFIISGQAGMGKSTIAAVTCKRFPEHFGACHFFQYNNSRYNNPKFLLQSLAGQLCHVIPEYKQNLTNNLSGNKAQLLDDLNIEGLFLMLFEEPFSNIPNPGKHFLIVIDALDECRQEEKQKLVDLITKHFQKFPRFIRFLITTRQETDIARKVQELNPLFLGPDDERNLKDLQFFFEDKLRKISKDVPREELVKKFVEKSEGLMLYASFLCKLAENGSIISNTENLPGGIEEVYDMYFNRLENELRKLGIDERQFLKFLSIIAVSKRPLPLALLQRLLSSGTDLSIAARTLRKLINCLSSLLVIKDECVSFFHKSVKDWLVKPNHDFTIIETDGHRNLADICVFQMQTMKQDEVSLTFDLAIVYALHYEIQHILEAEIKDMHCLTKLTNNVTDLEIVYASVCSDIYTTLSNLSRLESYDMHNSLICEEMQTTIRKLISIIRKFTYFLKDLPQSFLQLVVNENDDVLSSKASALLMTRYRGLAYFESEDEMENTEKAMVGRVLTGHEVLEIDISPSEDFLVCGYERGVELFSLPDFQSLWKIDDFVVERNVDFVLEFYLGNLSRCIIFHPLENVIFPGQLTPVLTFEGKFKSGQIVCEEIPNKFTSCCFSHDKTKMVTNYGIHLTVWNLLENKKIVSLSCLPHLFSVLFSANDRFIGTTNFNVVCVYDTENSYSMVSRSRVTRFQVLGSTFRSDSWIVYSVTYREGEVVTEIVHYDLTIKHISPPVHATWPRNARAAAEFQAVIVSDDSAWFEKLIGSYCNFFILSNESVLRNGTISSLPGI